MCLFHMVPPSQYQIFTIFYKDEDISPGRDRQRLCMLCGCDAEIGYMTVLSYVRAYIHCIVMQMSSWHSPILTNITQKKV